uniref:Integrase, catalytic region, zinc finger, CCHC-type, peptidase aspartic, catalytic n=1 Tax=Tanacetum cinerariifolium TaxID=118510 RepID=A0A6L2LX79_TANCI|nr:integrase, catalytic region, zinc finger, CCHC-type, peptidase aspartic, catalytic [Tanacetum cinerariifolium]
MKPKRVKDYSYHKEKMMLCKQEEKCVLLSAEQSDWLYDIDEELDEQELEAYYMYVVKIQEVLHVTNENSKPTSDTEPLEQVQNNNEYNVFAKDRQHFEQHESSNDTYVMETVDSNVIPNHSDMCNNEFEDDQNANDHNEDERVELANLIENLKLDIYENKKIQKIDAEVPFIKKRKSTCYIRDLQGNDLIMGTRGSDLYIIAIQESSSPTLICFVAKASPTQAWLWHRRLSHLNFDTINLLSKNDIVNDLPKDGENIDKINKIGDPFISVGYSTTSKGYRVYNKRTRLIVEFNHINFDEFHELSKASDYDNSDTAPQLQKTYNHNRSQLRTNDYINELSSSKLVPNVSPLADTSALLLLELDFLFSPLFEDTSL